MREKIPISNPLSEQPKEANARKRLGDFEADTVTGKNGKACLLTLTDRKSRFLICRKLEKKTAKCVKKYNDRSKEFSQHAEVTKVLGVDFYFPLPHHP